MVAFFLWSHQNIQLKMLFHIRLELSILLSINFTTPIKYKTGSDELYFSSDQLYNYCAYYNALRCGSI